MLSIINGLDSAIFGYVNQTLANPFFDLLFPLITEEKNWIVPLFVFYFFLFRIDWKRALLALTITVIGLVVTDVISAQFLKPLFGRIRPSHEMSDVVRLLVGKGGKMSFPSNHAANSMAFAFITAHFYPRAKGLLYLIAGLVAFSRVYVGVHYPGDVLGGVLFGTMTAIGTLHIYSFVKLTALMKKDMKRDGRISVVHGHSSP